MVFTSVMMYSLETVEYNADFDNGSSDTIRSLNLTLKSVVCTYLMTQLAGFWLYLSAVLLKITTVTLIANSFYYYILIHVPGLECPATISGMYLFADIFISGVIVIFGRSALTKQSAATMKLFVLGCVGLIIILVQSEFDQITYIIKQSSSSSQRTVSIIIVAQGLSIVTLAISAILGARLASRFSKVSYSELQRLPTSIDWSID
ncbi:hypothetical protein HDU93_009929 [Gonapodya sp. JEL0774]|nr:hypothetical protein HDU93_009929 [Gonapodya sp. JEL0774]